jgi:uncharacterized damage-inducible protein DinB
MITPAFARTMAAYNAEMNSRIYAAADRLGDAERRSDRGAFWGSIHGTLSHLMWGDRMWMSRFDGWERPSCAIAESGRMIEDFDVLARTRSEADAGIVRWASGLDDQWLKGELSWYSGALQRDFTANRGFLVVHFFNHQTHHRGQVHALLTAAGERTGDTDLFAILPNPL